MGAVTGWGVTHEFPHLKKIACQKDHTNREESTLSLFARFHTFHAVTIELSFPDGIEKKKPKVQCQKVTTWGYLGLLGVA